MRHKLSELATYVRKPGPHGFRVRIKIDENKAAEDFRLDRRQTDLLRIKPRHRFQIQARPQLTVQLVGPGVVRANKSIRVTAALHQLMCAVLADIIKSTNLLVLVQNTDKRLVGDVDREIVPWLF